MISDILQGIYFGTFIYYTISFAFYFCLILFASQEIFRFINSQRLSDINKIVSAYSVQPISVIIPVKDIGELSFKNIKRLLNFRYPNYEVILINDRDNNQTKSDLLEVFELKKIHTVYRSIIKTKPIIGYYKSTIYKNLILIDKTPGSRGDALNASLNIAKYPLCCIIPENAWLREQALLDLAGPFMANPEKTAAVAALLTPVIPSKINNKVIDKISGSMSVLQYLKWTLIMSIGCGRLNSSIDFSDSAVLLSKKIIFKAGGFLASSNNPLSDSIMRIQRMYKAEKKDYRVKHLINQIGWIFLNKTRQTNIHGVSDFWDLYIELFSRHNKEVFKNSSKISFILLANELILKPATFMITILVLTLGLLSGAFTLNSAVLIPLFVFIGNIILNLITLILIQISQHGLLGGFSVSTLGWSSIIEYLGPKQKDNITILLNTIFSYSKKTVKRNIRDLSKNRIV